jgi:sporulation protein YlmC with PRC-barrel domain
MKVLATVAALALMTGVATAQSPSSPSMSGGASNTSGPATAGVPAEGFTVKNYYNQSVYDRSDNKIGTIDDVLIDKDGKIHALIIGVGGFLGVGQKDVSVPFQKVELTKKNNSWYLYMDANKDQLKQAQGLKYDSNTTTWVADTGNTGGTTGSATSGATGGGMGRDTGK